MATLYIFVVIADICRVSESLIYSTAWQLKYIRRNRGCVQGRVSASLVYFTAWYRMGWLRLVGSLKLQVSFAKEPYKRDGILQKRPIILWSLLIIATAYVFSHTLHTCGVSRCASGGR